VNFIYHFYKCDCFLHIHVLHDLLFASLFKWSVLQMFQRLLTRRILQSLSILIQILSGSHKKSILVSDFYYLNIRLFIIIITTITIKPVPMAARSKARTVFGRSNIGIAVSNPAWGMDVCPRFFCFMLSCVGRGLASGWSPLQEVLPTVQIDSQIQKLNFWTGTGRWPIPWRIMIIITINFHTTDFTIELWKLCSTVKCKS
jgi:hypothetical protein